MPHSSTLSTVPPCSAIRAVKRSTSTLRLSSSTAGKGSIYLEEVCRTLERAMGRKVSVTGGGRRGKITLEYYDADDFEQLYEYLSGGKGRE